MVKQLDITKTEKILKEFKIPFPESKIAKNKTDAKKYAKLLGYPVVMKALSKDILHKTDVGGVKTNLNSRADIDNAFEDLFKLNNVKEFLIQKQIEGIEVFAGMKRDPSFGPVLALGLGGIFVEIIKDVSFRVAPITKTVAKEMIKSIKGYSLLKGFRGKEKVNIDALAEILVKLSNLSIKNKKIKEIDFNPIIVNVKKAKVVDARLIL